MVELGWVISQQCGEMGILIESEPTNDGTVGQCHDDVGSTDDANKAPSLD